MPPLNLPSLRGGRRPAPLAFTVLGELTAQDLAEAQDSEAPPSRTPQLTALRARHHEVARLLASGLKPQEVARVTGYCISRISILQADPTFVGLVEFYAEQVRDQFVDLAGRYAALSLTAIEVLQDRLEESPDKIPERLLLDLANSGADRLGLPAVQRSQSTVTVFDATEVARIKREAGDANVLTLTRTAPQEYRASDNPGHLLLDRAGGGESEAEIPRSKSEGPEV